MIDPEVWLGCRMPECELCAKDFADETMKICWECAARIGVVRMPPATRPPAPCMRCNGRKFVRAVPREHTTEVIGQYNGQVSAPMFLTHVPTVDAGWLSTTAKPIDATSGHGMLETYVCWRCGFVEWYCSGVQQIPIHPMMMTELIDYESDAPYR